MEKFLSDPVLERELVVRSKIEEYSLLFNLDPNLVRAIITQESRFVSNARSPTGAYGYGQFTSIGAKQVTNIAQMNSNAADLKNFTKFEADEADAGIKAICATLWWLFFVKYKNVLDKKTQLEAVTTFYNSGGKPAALVVEHGGHSKALPFIKSLPANQRAQSEFYAPEVNEWYVLWHVHTHKSENKVEEEVKESLNPFEKEVSLNSYSALIEGLKTLNLLPGVIVNVVTRDGETEVSIVFPGE